MLRLDLYRTVEAVDFNLTVEEKRLAAYVTSVVNSTPHCSSGLELQLHRLGIDPEVIARAAATPEALAVPATNGGTRSPPTPACWRRVRRRSGPSTSSGCAWSDRHLDVLDLNNIVAYYAYINRVATGLGLLSTIPAEHAFGAAPE